MRILLVKTSSLGDVIHALPAVSDMVRAMPGVQIDWCVEENFAGIPRLHPAIAEAIPVAIRRWRKNLFSRKTWSEIGAFRKRLGATHYDAVLDTQGLIKSGLITFCAHGRCYGYAAEVAREPLASWFYDKTFVIPPNAHAVERNRWLSAAAFDYPVGQPLDYGIATPDLSFPWLPDKRGAVLFTATSRDDKLWPEDHWVALGEKLAAEGFLAVLPAGNPVERQRAARLAKAIPGAIAAPAMKLPELATLLDGARGVVGVDTGLSHLAVALSVPTVALYTATEPGLTGVLGPGFHRNLGGKGQTPAVSQVIDALTPVLS